jgi:CBS domain-containing protein
VAEVMASPVICADPVTDIRRIARVLLESGLSALPVVDDAGKLAGIVSRGDILRAALADPPLSLWI